MRLEKKTTRSDDLKDSSKDDSKDGDIDRYNPGVQTPASDTCLSREKSPNTQDSDHIITRSGPKAKDSSKDSNHSDELATNNRKNADKTTKYWGGHDKPEEHKFWGSPSKKKPQKGGLIIQAEDDTEEGPLPHDGIIRVERKPYRTPLPSKYKEPELPDVLEDSDWIYRDFGKSLAKQREELPPTTACRYWPEIRLVSPHGSLTTRTNIPPDSAKAHLRKSHGLQVWREEDVNIADARLVGPFNFTLLRMPAIPNKRKATTKHNLVDSSIWTKLEVVLDEQGINRTSIHRIVPCNFAEMLPCCSYYF